MYVWQMRSIALLCLAALLASCSDDDSGTNPAPATTAVFVVIPSGQNPVTGEDIAGFELSRTEVLQEEWDAVMPVNPSTYRGGDLPVHNITWYEAIAYCDSLNARGDGYRYRLPSVAEWEYACRAGTTTHYYSGNQTVYNCRAIDVALGRVGWYCGNAYNEPHPAACKEPNAWGLYDMHGNVPEWCSDAVDSLLRVTKGGGYMWSPEWSRVSFSVLIPADCRDCAYDEHPLGFRIVREKK